MILRTSIPTRYNTMIEQRVKAYLDRCCIADLQDQLRHHLRKYVTIKQLVADRDDESDLFGRLLAIVVGVRDVAAETIVGWLAVVVRIGDVVVGVGVINDGGGCGCGDDEICVNGSFEEIVPENCIVEW